MPILAEDSLGQGFHQRVVKGLRFAEGLQTLLGLRQLQSHPVPVPRNGVMQGSHQGVGIEFRAHQAILRSRPQGTVFKVLVALGQDQNDWKGGGHLLQLLQDILIGAPFAHHDEGRIVMEELLVPPSTSSGSSA